MYVCVCVCQYAYIYEEIYDYIIITLKLCTINDMTMNIVAIWICAYIFIYAYPKIYTYISV